MGQFAEQARPAVVLKGPLYQIRAVPLAPKAPGNPRPLRQPELEERVQAKEVTHACR
jgi:hypothetical protein